MPLKKSCPQLGETVLDLGCGRGEEVFEAARLVGSKGFVYGLDMTPEMLEVAREKASLEKIENVSFIEGVIEDIPLHDSTVNRVISNCVINLSSNRADALAEAFRVLKPGGRLVIADIVALGAGVSPKIERLIAPVLGCVNGVLSQDEYLTLLGGCGFENGEVEVYQRYELNRIYHKALKRTATEALAALENPGFAERVHGAFASVYVLAIKP